MGLTTKKVEILPKICSVHNPIMWLEGAEKKQFHWKLNEELLNQQQNVKFIKKETRLYFKINKEAEVQAQTVWDAYKAVMRGNLIMLNNYQ